MFDEIFVGLLSLDLDTVKNRAEEVVGHWNGEATQFIGADGEVYTDEDAQVMNDIIKVVEELESLLEEAGCIIDNYRQNKVQLSIAASKLGSVTSLQKAKASAENGKKGGRPKNPTHITNEDNLK